MKEHIQIWLPFYEVLENLYGQLPSDYIRERKRGLTMEHIEKTYVCLMKAKEKYPLWWNEAAVLSPIQ